MRSVLLATMNSLWFMVCWGIFFKRRLCALRAIYVGTRVSINCRCLIKFCWWLEEAAMCRDVHQGLRDLCCHARFSPNSYTLLSIDTQLLRAELCRKLVGFHSEASGTEPAIDLWTDTHPFTMTVRTFATYLLPSCRSTLKIIFHSTNSSRQHGIFAGHFHTGTCRNVALHNHAGERERGWESLSVFPVLVKWFGPRARWIHARFFPASTCVWKQQLGIML